ncbi:MAG TPA: AMP-binding protein [Chthoniobacterales bacterium]|nr:AMP-binding protein [Chthoniobacterales bacterium]
MIKIRSYSVNALRNFLSRKGNNKIKTSCFTSIAPQQRLSVYENSNIAALFLWAGESWAAKPAFATRHDDGNFHAVSYHEWCDRSLNLATALIDLGVAAREHVGLFSDNRLEWILADAAVQFCGAADVPRGSDITDEEMVYILNHADIKVLFLENSSLLHKMESVKERLPNLCHVILMEDATSSFSEIRLLSLQELEMRGETLRLAGDRRVEERLDQIAAEDLCTMIYTSGTTGIPKGVQLTHAAIVSQIRNVPFGKGVSPRILEKRSGTDPFSQNPGTDPFSDPFCEFRALSILPVWHSYERIFEIITISQGGCTYYTSLRHLASDFRAVRPTVIASSPRLWEALYERMMKGIKEQQGMAKKMVLLALWSANAVGEAKRFFTGQQCDLTGRSWISSLACSLIYSLQWMVAIIPFLWLDRLVLAKFRSIVGGELKATISGGGALPPYIDRFFNNIGIALLEGYGLTESAPVLAVRTLQHQVIGTVGPLLPETEIKIINCVTGETLYPDSSQCDLGKGLRGEICARGPQLMKGYYKDPEGTERVLRDGWLHTGDIGMMTFNNCLKIVGRCKETIVLRSGENVEPLPIESRLLESPLIAQCIVVGQDQKYLGALIVPSLNGLGKHGLNATSLMELMQQREVLHRFFREEIRRLVSAEHGFKPFERIVVWHLLSKPFEIGDELTATYKLKRHVIAERYKEEIEGIF